MWLECKGGEKAARKFLERKGEAAFGFNNSPYAQFVKDYTLRCVLMDERQGRTYGIALQPSYIGEGDLFVQADFVYKKLELDTSVAEQFDKARKEFDGLFKYMGLETQVEQ